MQLFTSPLRRFRLLFFFVVGYILPPSLFLDDPSFPVVFKAWDYFQFFPFDTVPELKLILTRNDICFPNYLVYRLVFQGNDDDDVPSNVSVISLDDVDSETTSTDDVGSYLDLYYLRTEAKRSDSTLVTECSMIEIHAKICSSFERDSKEELDFLVTFISISTLSDRDFSLSNRELARAYQRSFVSIRKVVRMIVDSVECQE